MKFFKNNYNGAIYGKTSITIKAKVWRNGAVRKLLTNDTSLLGLHINRFLQVNK